MLRIYYKNTCSTCRTAYALLKEATGEPIEKVDYIAHAPSEKELREVVRMLGVEPEQLVRKKESLYKEKYAHRKLTGDQWIAVLHKHPVLIQRPIVIRGSRALIGRPATTVVDFVKPAKKKPAAG
jgi:arsenate reductase